jgi:tRNA(fMet)-specific endonuclease VapC
MATARVFRSGNSQAVRLPKDYRLKGPEVEIFRRGEEIVLREKAEGLVRAFEILVDLPADVLPEDRGDREAVLSVITYGELVYGVEKSQVREQARGHLAELASLLPVMELPMRAGEFYGSIRATLAARGDMIGNNDLWIAAHAKAAGLILVTNNEREFRRIHGLEIQNWAD